MNDDKPVRILLAHAIREASGMGLMDVGNVMRDAEENLDGDYVLAALARHAHAFAVTIRSTDPSITKEQARRAWDLDWARGLRATVGDEWAEVERLGAIVAAERDAEKRP